MNMNTNTDFLLLLGTTDTTEVNLAGVPLTMKAKAPPKLTFTDAFYMEG